MRRFALVLLVLAWIAVAIGPAYASGRAAAGQGATQTSPALAAQVAAASSSGPVFRLDSITCCFLGPAFASTVGRYPCILNPGLDLWATRHGTDLQTQGPAVHLALEGTIVGFMNSPDETLQPSPGGSFGLIAKHSDPLHPGQTIYTAYVGMASFDSSTNGLGTSYVNQSLMASTSTPYPAGTLLGYQGDLAVFTTVLNVSSFESVGSTQVHFAVLSPQLGNPPTDQCGDGVNPSPYVGADVTFSAFPNAFGPGGLGTPLSIIPRRPAGQAPVRTPPPRIPASQTAKVTPSPRLPVGQAS